MRGNLLSLLLIFGGLGLTIYGRNNLIKTELPQDNSISVEREALYLPSGPGLKAISIGYHNVVSNLLWFNTINYFGKHYRSDKQYRWLYHMCDLVTLLNPRLYEQYFVCATILAWEANAVAQAVQLLSKADSIHKDWYFLYLRGFYRMYFLKDLVGAHQDFAISSQRDGAPAIVGRLAAKKLAELSSPAVAIDFLEGLIQRTTDPTQRQALTARLEELKMKEGSS